MVLLLPSEVLKVIQPQIAKIALPAGYPIEYGWEDEVLGYGRPIKAGEFILDYPGEVGTIGYFSQPDVLDKNGSFLVLRK